jgi:cytochrome c-type biogenesis protein CcmH
MKRLLVLVAMVLAAAAPATASGQRPTLGELEAEVMCPTCKTLLEVSEAPVADRMRVFIRSRIAAGDTKSEIKAKLVTQFGEAVLASPPKRGLNLIVWLAPMATLIGGCLVLAWLVQRSSRRRADAEDAVVLDAETEAEVALALAEAER